MATETLSWAAQTVGADEQLAILGLGTTYTSTSGGSGGSVNVSATLLPGQDIEAEIDYNYSSPGVFDFDTGYLNAGEIYAGAVYTGEVGGVPTTTDGAFLLTNDGDTYTSPSGLSHTVTAQFDFATNDSLTYEEGVENLSFWIGDIDSGTTTTGTAFDQIEIIAYAPDGVTLIDATDIQFLSAGGNVNTSIVGGVATLSSGPDSVAIDSADGAVQVFIAVPVGRIEVVYYNGSTGAQAISISDFSFESIPLVPDCFAAGTQIKTPIGTVAVEVLKVDDLVVTAGNGPMPIRWIGHRRFAAKGKLAPICITKGTLGNTRDLLVSPMHRLAISGFQVAALFDQDEVLVPAEALLDGDRIYRKSGGEVTYYHILLDSHEILFAEGAAAESLFIGQDGNERSGFSQATRDEVRAIFPELEMAVARPVLTPAEAALLTSFAVL